MDHHPIRWLLALCIALLIGGLARAQTSYYVDFDPPGNWRPATADSGGTGIVNFSAGGSPGDFSAGSYLYLAPGDPTLHPIAKVYDDPFMQWLWDLAPGRQAYAVAPVAGVMVMTGLRYGSHRMMASAWLRFSGSSGTYVARQGFRGLGGPAGRSVWKRMLGAAGFAWFWNEIAGRWEKEEGDGSTVSDGQTYTAMADDLEWSMTKQQACQAWIARYSPPGANGYNTELERVEGNTCKIKFVGVNDPNQIIRQDVHLRYKTSTCVAGWYILPDGTCSINAPPLSVTEEEWLDKMRDQVLPPDLLDKLPDGIPVDDPTINPRPAPTSPGQPFFQPTGGPVPNKDFNPSAPPSTTNPTHLQPGRDVKGSPTGRNPWRGEAMPVNKPVNPGTPSNETDPASPPDPNADPNSPPTGGGGGNNKPSEKQPLVCEVFPMISACQNLGSAPAPSTVKNENKTLRIDKENGFGPSDGTCPPPRQIVTTFGSIEMPWTLICSFAEMLRPLVIGLAWLTAAFTFMGFTKRGA